MRNILLALPLAAIAGLSPALARSGALRYAPGYSGMRGFNYNPVSAKNGDDARLKDFTCAARHAALRDFTAA